MGAVVGMMVILATTLGLHQRITFGVHPGGGRDWDF